MKKPFLLSPAGSYAALKAAVDAGADEVYLGGSEFNARMNAGNFDRAQLIKASELCRKAGVKLHITLNTLVFDREFRQVLEYADFLASEVCPNALIVQDIGLACELRRRSPRLALHASTQMRIHSPGDAVFLKELGFTRAVLARELPKSDIAEFAATGLETEIFVHGAICVSESGGCLMSSVIGGRSGNRGECAQPCRLPYRTENNKYPLSLKDMCLAGHITELCRLGVTSLKIEGRMKSPEYVGAVTSVYRRLIDEDRNATESEMKLLKSVFSRSGFTDGYFSGRIGSDMFGIRREEDKRGSDPGMVFPKAPPRERAADPIPEAPRFPQRNDEKAFSPKFQRGFVLRFEGRMPSDAYLSRFAERAARIDLPLFCCTEKRFAPYAGKISAVLPRSIFGSEREEVKKQLEKAAEFGIKHATVSSLNQIELCGGFYLHGDYAFNVVNRASLEYLENLSFSSVMLSPETDGRFPKGSRCALEYIGYGRTPLMYTRTCIIANISGCLGKKRCFSTLTDRIGAEFPIISTNSHGNVIYNSLPAYRLDRAAELKKSGVGLITLLFTSESEKETAYLTQSAFDNKKPDIEFTRK